MNEDVPTNNISSGNVAKFDPKLGINKKKTSDLVKRWMPKCP